MTNDNRQSPGSEDGHVRRVAAWCAEIAGKLNLPRSDQEVLGQAARLHHLSKLVLDDAAWTALRRDLGIASTQESPQPDVVIQVLRALQSNQPVPARIRKLAQILEQCDDLDSGCELDAIVSAEPELNGLDGLVSEIAGYFGGVTRGDLDRAAARIPVFDTIAYRAIALLGNENTNLGDVESLVAADQTLAGHVVNAANSALQDSAIRVESVRQAVIRIGMDSARQIVSATSLRRLFEAKHSQSLWNHSLDVAEAAANIAGRSGMVKRDEAFLAGLTHDVGKLVILNLPGASLARQERLTRSGCPDPIVERVILGEDHASIGARVLRGWLFSERIAEAVESHHTPERSTSPLSSVLYVAEVSQKKDHGLDSGWRDELARTSLRLGSDDLRLQEGFDKTTSSLRFAVAA